ncbi:hypothetical protein [Clostridium akagii]|uniref:hypothetical protein n=1 Tax=Clostridium akagii TaxID=91623 RepID=UPI00047DC812|nr:hypothetical protein [Clostridium akagii]
MDKIIWNEDMDISYGVKIYFENEKDFQDKVTEEYRNITKCDCLVGDVKIKSCISTGKGLNAESITPLEKTDIEINTYYIADVEKAELYIE